MMNRTGGGFLKSGRMGNEGLPDAMPAKPMGIPPQAIAQPQAGPPGAGGPVPGPPGGVPQGPPQGASVPGGPPPGPEGGAVNDVANNAMLLLHDPEAGPAFDQLISRGPEGAGQALFELYAQLRDGYEAQGQVIDEEAAGDAIAMVLGDVYKIGQANGGLQADEDIGTAMQHAFQLIAQAFPDAAGDLEESFAEQEAPQGAPAGPAQGGGGFLQ